MHRYRSRMGVEAMNKTGACRICLQPLTWRHDHKPDLSGLDDGPPIPRQYRKKVANAPVPPAPSVARKPYTKQTPEAARETRARAWETRRAKYGQHGHR